MSEAPAPYGSMVDIPEKMAELRALARHREPAVPSIM